MIQRKFGSAVLVILCAGVLYAQSIDEPELRSVDAQDVEFVNYNGPYAVINTAEQIRNIGADLGRPVNAGAQQAGAAERYQILHIVDPAEPQGLDADILILGANAGVDHIRNLRRIVSAYLIAAYGYQLADADALAVFITVYNAVYRGQLNYFSSKYKPAVMSNLTAARVGLALNYREWPGGTQIVIPLAGVRAGADIGESVSPVDTSLISDSNVIESLRKEDDKGVDERKQMVDIKEREADQLQERADRESAQQLVEEEKLEREREEAQQARRAADQAQQEAAQNPDDAQAAQRAEQAEQQAVKAEEQAAEQELVAQEQAQKADEAQQAADTKRAEAADERKAIAQDQTGIIAQITDAQAAGAVVYGLHLVDSGGLLSAVVKVSNQNGQILKESPVQLVRARTMFHAADGIIAIAGESDGNRTVRLVVLDLADMEIVRQSEEAVSDSSVLAVDGSNNYYVVIKDGAIWALGKYNAQLQLQQKSTLAVNPATPIVFTPAGIIVTGADGSPKLLRLTDLTEMK